MLITQSQFVCSQCGKPIDIGEPFLATAVYPAHSYMQSDSVDANFLQHNGEVLCQTCTIKRLGEEGASKLQGALFASNHAGKGKTEKVKHE